MKSNELKKLAKNIARLEIALRDTSLTKEETLELENKILSLAQGVSIYDMDELDEQIQNIINAETIQQEKKEF